MEHKRLPETMCESSQSKWRYCLLEKSYSPLSGSHDSHSPGASFSVFIIDKKFSYKYGTMGKEDFETSSHEKDRL